MSNQRRENANQKEQDKENARAARRRAYLKKRPGRYNFVVYPWTYFCYALVIGWPFLLLIPAEMPNKMASAAGALVGVAGGFWLLTCLMMYATNEGNKIGTPMNYAVWFTVFAFFFTFVLLALAFIVK
jgi:hypothetical protein